MTRMDDGLCKIIDELYDMNEMYIMTRTCCIAADVLRLVESV
jgi:hypothetical protein